MTKINVDANTHISSTYMNDVAQVGQSQAVQSQNAVQSAPSPAPSDTSTPAPVLTAPSSTDYAGASSFSIMYTELIVLMCQINRDSYEANQEIATMQMESRVADLKEAASKRLTAAIVGLAAGIVSFGASAIGGALSGASLLKNSNSLKSAQGGGKALQEKPGLEIEMQDNIKKDNLIDKTSLPDESPLTNKKNITSDTDTQNIKNKEKLGQMEASDANTINKEQKSTSQEVKENNTIKKEEGTEKADASTQKTEDMDENQQRKEMAAIENRTATTQLLTMLTRTASEGASSLGNSTSGIINATADGIQAGAEETEAQRQLSISNRQQFQDFMSKFNSILQSFLEAEMKAASAAAQV